MILKEVGERRRGMEAGDRRGKWPPKWLHGLPKCNSDNKARCMKAVEQLLEEEQGSRGCVHSRRDFSSCDLHMEIYGSSSDFRLPLDT